MKIALTGATGLVGAAFAEAALRRGHTLLAIGHSRSPSLPGPTLNRALDLREPDALERELLEFFPDVIVNAAAASSPAAVEADPASAERLNVALPRRLAQIANHLSARFLHLSTDMVFDGEKGDYRSTDMPCPRDLYGQMKLLAEKDVLRFGGEFAVVLRIAIVTGNSLTGTRSLHERLFQAWAEGRRTPLFTDELRQPVSASNVGEVLTELGERANLHGIFHWAGPDRLSRYEIGRRILERFGLPETLILAASLRDAPTPRAANLTLNLHPLEGKLKTAPEPFERQLEAMQVPEPYAAWYAQTTGKPGVNGKPKRFVRGVDF